MNVSELRSVSYVSEAERTFEASCRRVDSTDDKVLSENLADVTKLINGVL